MSAGFQIRSLSFHGADREPATLRFGPGLNVIYGASNTGKSFVVEAIDFMLGGKSPLPDIPERIGYDRVLLSLENISTETLWTLERSHEGGAFRLHEGEFCDQLPDEDGLILSETHSDKSVENLSAWLLTILQASGARLKKNQKNKTISLSFRHLARLAIINEEEIIQKRSPLADGNYTADTANFSAFKFLLTGTDDSALVATEDETTEEASRNAQLDLLDDLIRKYSRQIKDIGKKPSDLEEQDDKLGVALAREADQLQSIEQNFKSLSSSRRKLTKRVDNIESRLTEVNTLLNRFELLEKHYQSDIERLRGIEEAGSLFAALGKSQCPVCGADPSNHKPEDVCEGDVDRIVSAAAVEIRKIGERLTELGSTIGLLNKEQGSLRKRLPDAQNALAETTDIIRRTVAPDLKKRRGSYTELSDKRVAVRDALNLYETVRDLEDRKAILIAEDEQASPSSNMGTQFPSSVADAFAVVVEKTLKTWHFPNADRVHFDLKKKDLVIGGKERTAFGKGLRAITQAAFSISLLRFTLHHDGAHPGFVVLDSPLLSYRAPEDTDDDLASTGLKEAFFEDLASTPIDQQMIIVENIDPIPLVKASDRAIEFTGREGEGRPGLFP